MFLGIQGDLKDQALAFVEQFKNKDSDGENLERQLLGLLIIKRKEWPKKRYRPQQFQTILKQ